MRNAELHLRACLDALVAQRYPSNEYEILLVDNGSTDRSVETARRYESVTLLAEPVLGAYRARNRGIKAARGDILAFTDSDCAPHAAWLSEIAAAMSDPRLELLCGRRIPAGQSLVLQSIGAYENTKDAFVIGGNDAELYYGYSSNMAVRRDVFERLGPFLELHRGADTLFVRQLAAERTPVAIRYQETAIVTHLELDRLSLYYKKVFLYAYHRHRNNSILRSRPLNRRERMTVYRQTIAAGGYGLLRSALVFGALGVGALVWLVGTASARFAPTAGASAGSQRARRIFRTP